MAAPIDDDNLPRNDDYYSLLNAGKEATNDELKIAYRRACMIYHPDKHQDPAKKDAAEKLFSKIQKAYEVLSNPQSRAIYDIYGEKGLEAGWELVERRQTPSEIRAEYERLRREREERHLQQRTNPRGTISVGINATELFDQYEDFDDYDYGGSPSIEVSHMTITQSIEAPLTISETATLSGNLHTQNGTGSGQISASLRHILSSNGWAEFEFGAGGGPMIGIKGFRNITRRSFGTCQALLQIMPNGAVKPVVNTVLARQLDKHTVGYLTWKWGGPSSMNSMLIRDTQHSHFMMQFQLGIPISFVLFSFTKKFEEEGKARLALKAGTFGATVEYGGEKKISKHSRIGATMSIGIPIGVTVKIKINRGNQTYSFPIHLSDDINPVAIFYGTIAPITAFILIKALVVNPYLKKQKQREEEKKRDDNKEKLERRKREAETEVQLMQEMFERIQETESSKRGLLIVKAWYGQLVVSQTDQETNDLVIDVTIPLQCQVKNSKLILTEVSKSCLPGFYDPCGSEDRSLKVSYKFLDQLHECTILDNEPLRIPKQSHRVTES
ncbi:dnaJ homolog subfamily C member 11-like [Glandiceps talaboti]